MGGNDATLAEMIAEAHRELRVRKRIYPTWVSSGTIEKRTAEKRIRVQAAILARLEAARDAGSDDAMIPDLLKISEPER